MQFYNFYLSENLRINKEYQTQYAENCNIAEIVLSSNCCLKLCGMLMFHHCQ